MPCDALKEHFIQYCTNIQYFTGQKNSSEMGMNNDTTEQLDIFITYATLSKMSEVPWKRYAVMKNCSWHHYVTTA